MECHFPAFSLSIDCYPSNTVQRSVTTQRKSDQSKSARSHSVPSLNSIDTTMSHVSPTRTPRSNSVRGSKVVSTTRGGVSIKKRIAKMLGSHSDLTGKTIVSDERSSSGVYKQIGGFRPRSIGGSSDCSTSSLTSATQVQCDLSRNNSLRDSTRSRISQGSVFSTSRQASYDSADAINISVHGNNIVPPSESGLRPRSIACMQSSGSSTSLRVNSVDPRYHSIAAVPSRYDCSNDDKKHLYGHKEQEFEQLTDRVIKIKPSDPEYKKVAEGLMSCSPQPLIVSAPQPRPGDSTTSNGERIKKYSGDSVVDGSGNVSPRVQRGNTFDDQRRSLTPG